MPYQNFLISNFREGLVQAVDPWLLPNEAFAGMENMYVRRGVLTKRSGVTSFGQPSGGAAAIRGLFHFNRSSGTADQLLAFTATDLYKYTTGTSWTDVGNITSSTNLIWGLQYNKKMYFCDNNTSGRIMSWDGTTLANVTLDTNGDTSNNVQTALMMFMFKGRMLLLNTYEDGTTRHAQRVRWSQNGDVTVWDSLIPGKGGFNDAPTNDEIVSAAFVKNTLVVWFENSVWQLRYTGDPALPFSWQQINYSRKCKSTFGTTVYDKVVTAVGDARLLTCDGLDVATLDDKIPDFTYDIDLDYISGCYAKRVDRLDQSWLAYPTQPVSTANNKILGLNYEDDAWFKYAFKDGSDGTLTMTCFSDWVTAVDKTFGDYVTETFDDLSGVLWGDQALQSGYPLTMTASTNGFVYNILNEEASTDLGDAINFDVPFPRFNPFADQGRGVTIGYIDFLITREDDLEFTVEFYADFDSGDVPTLTQTVGSTADFGQKEWVRAYVGLTADVIQLRIKLSDAQLADASISKANVRIHAVNIYAKPAGRLS